MSIDLQGKSAIVTGAGGGICFEFARLLLERGVNVLLADLALRPEAKECIEKYTGKPKAVFLKTDVSSWNDLAAMFEQAEKSFDTIDIVCPGAGIFEPSFSNFWIPPGSDGSKDNPSSDRYKILDVNITHPIRVTQMAISHFLAREPKPSPDNIKFVIHTISTASEISYLPVPMYIASKWALSGFVRSLSSLDEELSIRVMGIAPGIVKTPLWTEAVDKREMIHRDGKMFEDWTPPEVIAERMLRMVTGDELISVDDGSKVDARGGLVLEAAASHVRPVPILNNTGPRSDLPGMGLTLNHEAQIADTWNRLKTPGWGQF